MSVDFCRGWRKKDTPFVRRYFVVRTDAFLVGIRDISFWMCFITNWALIIKYYLVKSVCKFKKSKERLNILIKRIVV